MACIAFGRFNNFAARNYRGIVNGKGTNCIQAGIPRIKPAWAASFLALKLGHLQCIGVFDKPHIAGPVEKGAEGCQFAVRTAGPESLLNDEPLFVLTKVGRRYLGRIELLLAVGVREPACESSQIAKVVLDGQWTPFGVLEKIGEAIQHREHLGRPLKCYTTSFSGDVLVKTGGLYDELGRKSTYNTVYTCSVVFGSVAILTRN